jgi:hypothetical protein
MFREGRNGNGIRYSGVTFPTDPYRGVERTIRTAKAVGWISNQSNAYPAAYAILDVLDEDGDIIADYAVLDACAFRHIKKKLNLVVESDD